MADDITVRIEEVLLGFGSNIGATKYRIVAEQIVEQLGLEREYDEYDEDGDRIPPYTRWCTAWELVDKPVAKPTSGGPWHYLRTMMRRGGLD